MRNVADVMTHELHVGFRHTKHDNYGNKKNSITSKPCFISEQNVAYKKRVQGTLLLHPLAEVNSGREVRRTETLYAMEVVGVEQLAV
jgi:hypothetical protein